MLVSTWTTKLMAFLEELVSMEYLEPVVRKAVTAEMEPVMERVIASVLDALTSVNSRTLFTHRMETSQGIGYQLVFANKLPGTIFTDSKIEAEENGPIKIELVDTINKSIVTSGPLSSLKIQIVVLDGDLGFEKHEIWTEQQFNAKVIEGKKDKRPLVIGDLDIALRDGVANLSDLRFTDNSSWIKCRKFRLSARVVTSNGGRVKIKEAISNAFKVKEYRAKRNEKHFPPSLDDYVWRLVKIAKDGPYCRRLADQHIYKVKDFRQMHQTNPDKLKDVLKCSDKLWNTIVNHASTCVGYDEKPNAVDGYNYQPPTKRSCIQEPLVESENDQANENMNILSVVDRPAILGQPTDLTSLQAKPIGSAFSGMHTCSNHASTSSSCKDGLQDHNHWLQLPVEKNNHPTQPSNPTCGDYNSRLDELLATEETVTNLPCSMTSQAPMPNAVEGHNYQPPTKRSSIQEPFVESPNDQAYGNVNFFYPVDRRAILSQSNHSTGMQTEPISTPTTGMHMGSYHAQNTPLIQASGPMCCEDYNLGMAGLQATCNEQTISNLAFDMTSQASMSTCPPDSALYEHNNHFHLASTNNNSEPESIVSLIRTPVNATVEDLFPYSVQSPTLPEFDFRSCHVSFPSSVQYPISPELDFISSPASSPINQN